MSYLQLVYLMALLKTHNDTFCLFIYVHLYLNIAYHDMILGSRVDYNKTCLHQRLFEIHVDHRINLGMNSNIFNSKIKDSYSA